MFCSVCAWDLCDKCSKEHRHRRTYLLSGQPMGEAYWVTAEEVTGQGSFESIFLGSDTVQDVRDTMLNETLDDLYEPILLPYSLESKVSSLAEDFDRRQQK